MAKITEAERKLEIEWDLHIYGVSYEETTKDRQGNIINKKRIEPTIVRITTKGKYVIYEKGSLHGNHGEIRPVKTAQIYK